MFKLYFLVALLLGFAQTANCEIPGDDIITNKVFADYTKLAVYMIKRFISPKTNTIVVTEKCAFICNKKYNYQSLLLNNLIHDLNDEIAIQMFMGRCNDQLWDYNVFVVDSHEAFLILRNNLPNTRHDRFFKFFVLLTWSAATKVELTSILYQIFKQSLSFNVSNVVVMCRTVNAKHFSFYSYTLFSSDTSNCLNNIVIREINRYENGTLLNPFLFVGHIRNLNGCWLNVSAKELQPFLNFDGNIKNQTHLMESRRLSGIEGEILKILAQALNFNIRLRFPREQSIINVNSNSTGCFRDLDQQRSQIAVGGFSSALENNEKYTTTSIYHTTPYVLVVRSGLCFGAISQLFNSLCQSTWILLLTIFAIASIFHQMVQTKPTQRNFVFGSKNTNPIFSMLSIFLGNPLPIRIVPTRNFARFLLTAWLLLSFEVRNGFQGKMYDSLRFSKRVVVPKKISQLLEKDYTLLSGEYLDFFPKDKTIIMRNTTKRLALLQIKKQELTATALLDSLAYYNFLHSNTSTLTFLDEIIYTFPCVMYFSKHSLIHHSFNRKLKILSATGIISHIENHYACPKFYSMNSRSQYSSSQLANGNLKGLYIISGIMYMISFGVFIFELLTLKSRRLWKIMNGLN